MNIFHTKLLLLPQALTHLFLVHSYLKTTFSRLFLQLLPYSALHFTSLLNLSYSCLLRLTTSFLLNGFNSFLFLFSADSGLLFSAFPSSPLRMSLF